MARRERVQSTLSHLGDRTMPRKAPKTVVAFKVEPALAELLDRLPNKSAFIRKAIAAQLGVPCALCRGKGIISRGVNEHYAPLLEKYNTRPCVKCAREQAVPLDDNS